MKVLVFAMVYAIIAVAVTTTGMVMAVMTDKKSPNAGALGGWFIVGLLWPIAVLTLMANWKEVRHA